MLTRRQALLASLALSVAGACRRFWPAPEPEETFYAPWSACIVAMWSVGFRPCAITDEARERIRRINAYDASGESYLYDISKPTIKYDIGVF